ncbi:MAG: DinB family protein [Roseibium sp.]
MTQIDPALYQCMASYNAWMTEQAYAAAEKMSDADRKLDRGAFFKSVHSTLNHILFADRSWMRRFSEKNYETGGMGEDLFGEFAELKAAHLDMCTDIVTFTDQLTSDWLAGPLEWTSVTDKVTRTRPRWVLLTHLFNHQTHHRGQLSTLLTQAGIDIGKTDLPFMPDLI